MVPKSYIMIPNGYPNGMKGNPHFVSDIVQIRIRMNSLLVILSIYSDMFANYIIQTNHCVVASCSTHEDFKTPEDGEFHSSGTER